MSNHSTNSTSFQGFSVCFPKDGECLHPAIECIIVLFNLISMLTNILHLILLNRIASLKGTAYGIILKGLSIADLYYTLPTILQSSCTLRLAVVQRFEVGLFFVTISGLSVYFRLFILTLASLERFLALCRPFKHSDSIFVRHMKVWSGLCCVAAIAFSVRDLNIETENTCLDLVTGFSNCANLRGSRRCAISMVLLSSISTIFLILVQIQLRKMNRVSTSVNREDKELKVAALYVLAMVLVFYFCFLVAIIDKIILWAFHTSVTGIGVVALLLNSLYGVLNTVIYGWVTPTYQHNAKLLLHQILLKLGVKNTSHNSQQRTLRSTSTAQPATGETI